MVFFGVEGLVLFMVYMCWVLGLGLGRCGVRFGWLAGGPCLDAQANTYTSIKHNPPPRHTHRYNFIYMYNLQTTKPQTHAPLAPCPRWPSSSPPPTRRPAAPACWHSVCMCVRTCVSVCVSGAAPVSMPSVVWDHGGSSLPPPTQ